MSSTEPTTTLTQDPYRLVPSAAPMEEQQREVIDEIVNEEEREGAEGEGGSECVLLSLCVLNASAYVGMLMAKEWAGRSLDATWLDYPTRLTPAPWVGEYLWTAISLSLLVFLMWPFLPFLSPERKRDVRRLSQPLVLAFIGQAMWSVLWAYQLLSLAALTSLMVCGQLLAVGLVLAKSPPLLRLPFSLWFGWTAYSTLAQATAALCHEAHIGFFASAWWSVAAMSSLSMLAFLWGSLTDDPFFSGAVAVAFFGVTQHHHCLTITRAAYLCCILVGAHALICLINAYDATRRRRAREDLAHVDDDDDDEDEYEREEAATLLAEEDDHEGAKANEAYLPTAPLLSLPVEASVPIYPAVYVVQPPMAVGSDELASYHAADYAYPYGAYSYPDHPPMAPAVSSITTNTSMPACPAYSPAPSAPHHHA